MRADGSLSLEKCVHSRQILIPSKFVETGAGRKTWDRRARKAVAVLLLSFVLLISQGLPVSTVGRHATSDHVSLPPALVPMSGTRPALDNGIVRTGGLVAAHVISTIPVGVAPSHIEFVPSNGDLYVSNSQSQNLSVINGNLNRVTTTVRLPGGPSPPGMPGEFAYNPRTNLLYATLCGSCNGFGSGTNVSVINTTDNSVVSNIVVGDNPYYALYDSSNGYLYVLDGGVFFPLSGYASEVNTRTNQTTNVTTGVGPWQALLNPVLSEVFVTDFGSNVVSVIDSSTGMVIENITVGSEPAGDAYDPANTMIYVANTNSSNLSIINGGTDRVVSNVAVGSEPWNVTYDPSNGEVFVVNYGSGNVTILNDTTNRVVANLGVGIDPLEAVYDPLNGDIYVVNANSNSVSIINGSSNAVVANVSVGSIPADATLDPANGDLYVVNSNSNSVSVIAWLRVSSFSATSTNLEVGQSTSLDVITTGGGLMPMTYNYTGLPPGCTDADVSVLHCTPSQAGVFNVRVVVSQGAGNTAEANLTLDVHPAVTVSSFAATPNPTYVGKSVSFQVAVSQGVPPYGYAYSGLPLGCKTADSPTLSCQPESAGTYTVRVTVQDSLNVSTSRTLRVVVQNSLFGLPEYEGLAIIGLVIVMLAVVTAVVLWIRRRKKSEPGPVSQGATEDATVRARPKSPVEPTRKDPTS